LIETLPATLLELDLSRSAGAWRKGKRYDLEMIVLLNGLPVNVRSIKYFGHTIRGA
jgi:hypothetical protein